jgi:hypothetical protein
MGPRECADPRLGPGEISRKCRRLGGTESKHPGNCKHEKLFHLRPSRVGPSALKLAVAFDFGRNLR